MRETILKRGLQSTSWLYLLLLYPIVDYILRNILPIPVISSFWDDGMLLVLLIFTFLAYVKGSRTLPSIKHPFLAFVMLGIGLMITDMANFDASVEGFRAIYQYMVAFFIGFYLLESVEQLNRFVKALVLVGFIIGLIGIAQVILGVQTPGNWVEEGEATRTRAFSIVTSPNVLGSYMAFISPVALGLFLNSRAARERFFWGIVTLTCVLALLFTFSRGAWFAFAIVLLISSFYWKPRIARWLLLAGVIGFVSLFFVPEGIPVLSAVSDRLTTLFSFQYIEKSLGGGRLGRWLEAYHKMRFEPLFGVGLGHHGGAVASRHFGTIYSDSYFFKSLAELGIIGVTLLISLVVMTLRYAAGVVRSFVKTPHFFMVLGLFCGLVAVSLHNLVENIFEVPFMALYFWLFGGFACKLYADRSQLKRW